MVASKGQGIISHHSYLATLWLVSCDWAIELKILLKLDKNYCIAYFIVVYNRQIGVCAHLANQVERIFAESGDTTSMSGEIING